MGEASRSRQRGQTLPVLVFSVSQHPAAEPSCFALLGRRLRSCVEGGDGEAENEAEGEIERVDDEEAREEEEEEEEEPWGGGGCILAIVASTRWASRRISRTRLAAWGRYEGKRSGREAENVSKAESISCSDNVVEAAAVTADDRFCMSSSASVSASGLIPLLASRATTTRDSNSPVLLLPLTLPLVSRRGTLPSPSGCCASSCARLVAPSAALSGTKALPNDCNRDIVLHTKELHTKELMLKAIVVQRLRRSPILAR